MSDFKHVRHKTIAFVIDSLAGSGSYQEDLWRSVSVACRQNGIGLLIFPGGALGGTPFAVHEEVKNIIYGLIRRECVDGVILAIGNIVHNASAKEYSDFTHSFGDLPVVNIGFELDRVPGVAAANEKGMELLVEHLVAHHGHRRVAFVRGPEAHEDAIQRFRAYQTVLKRYSIPFDPELTYIGNFSEQSGIDAVRTWLDRKIDFDCVAAAGDYMSIGAVKELIRSGKRVPQDIAVTGFDDTFEASILSPGLTTIRQPMPAQMLNAVNMLLDMIEQRSDAARNTAVDISIIKRRSCGCSASSGDSGFVLPEWTGENRERWLNEVSHTLVAGFRGTVRSEEMHSLFSALLNELEDKQQDMFLAKWEAFFTEHFRHSEDLSIVMNIISTFQNAVSIITGTEVRQADRLMSQAQHLFMEILFRLEAVKRNQVESLANQLRQVSLLLGSSFDIPLLRKIMQDVLPHLGINNFMLGLYSDPEHPLDRMEIIAHMRGGQAVKIPDDGKNVSPLNVLAGEKALLDAGGRGAVCPLYYRDSQIGLLFMELPSDYGFIYETIVSQLCIAINGAQLVEINVRARTASEEHYRKIEELSLPMMESISHITKIAMEKMESAHALVTQTKKSQGKIGETNMNIEKITASTNKLLEIILTIEDIAEQVNLLALNTAIEAAHVGKLGAGFTIIAKEIKKLAENSRQHSNEIAVTLKEIINSARDSSLNGQESVKISIEQEKGVNEIFNSFKTISERMQKLGEGSETILALIDRK